MFALVVTAITLGLQLVFDEASGGRPTLVIFTMPIMLSAYVGGLRAGLLATTVSFFGASYYLLPPIGSFAVASSDECWQQFFVVLAGVLISVLNEALHRARRRADLFSREHLQAKRALVKAETLQAAIFSSAYFSIIATDEEGVIQIFNVGAQRMLGYAAAEVVNKITPADLHDPREAIARATALGIEYSTTIAPGFEALVFKATRGIEDIYEMTKVRKDGSRFPAVLSITALRDPQGTIIGYLLIGTDNTARKQAEEALLKAGALQRAIFNSANFSSIATDAKGVIQIFNVGAERMLGYAAAEVMNQITPADISDPQEVIARATQLSVELGTPITPGFEALVFKASRGIEDIYELTYIRKDGSRFPAIVSVTALRDAEAAIIGYLLIGTDNTARKRAEEALLKAGALQRAIFNSANFSSIATDAKGVIQIFNVGAERMLGYAAADVMNQITPADISDPGEVIARATALSAELGTPITPGFEALVFKASRGIEDIYELTYIRKDGSRFPAVVSVTALRDAQDGIIGYLLIGTDNTARKQADMELQRANVKLRAWAEALNSFAIVEETDPQGRITYVNDPFCQISKSSRAELLGKVHRDVVSSGTHPKEFWKDMWGTISHGKRWRGEIKNRAKDGTVYWVDTVIVPLLGANERPETYLAIRFVITERKMAEEEWQRAEKKIQSLNTALEQRVLERTTQLDAANKELEAFSYSVSHDLRAPLRHVSGFVELLQRESGAALSEKSLRYLTTISQSAQRMGDLIDDLLTFSRIGKSELQKVDVNLDELVRDVMSDFQAAAMARNIVWEIHPLPRVRADHALMRQVLVNLISNAVKFTGARDDAKIEIGSAPGPDGERVIFIRDNGAGFDPRYAAKLFGVFQRLHSSNEFEGTGIGLANVQRIIHRHGGQVWAEGAVGAGATFSFSIPKQPMTSE
ncbi:MAG: Aerobic respiration control sensor protein ArcB [Prosthecobacter sp.]|nr:Aerobic respiration control sensor protein ArcB [Prosthecobacter sp.]